VALVLLLCAASGCESGGSKDGNSGAVAEGKPVNCEEATARSYEEWAAQCGAPSPTPGYDTEGTITTSDGRFVKYPDGFLIRFTKVETPPYNPAYEPPPGMTFVRVTLTLENGGSAPVGLSSVSTASMIALLYGDNRYSASLDLSDDTPSLPARIVPKPKVTAQSAFNVPNGEMEKLAVRVDPIPGHYTDFTFVDVESALP
jgi:hypothetical protein